MVNNGTNSSGMLDQIGAYVFTAFTQELPHALQEMYTHPGVSVGILTIVFLFFLLMLGYSKFRESGIVMFFDSIYQLIYEFFEDIVGKDEKRRIKMYVVAMFFIILFSNLLGVFLEVLMPIFGEVMNEKGVKEHVLHHYISIPTADINFNVAMAIIGVVIVIIEQFKYLGIGKGLYEYFPILGKNYIPFEKGNLPKYIDWPLFIFVKIFDIFISLFLGVLEIVGHFAKIISLAFRLFGNVTSGGLLLTMLIGGISGLTVAISGIEFPVLGPIIIYLQEILVALIQALVFPLLVGIFIKVAKTH